MMAEKQVIIVKEAQSLKKIEELEYYASKPLASTILVINYKYKTLDGRTKLYKAIQKNGVILTTKKLYENQVHTWVVQYLKQFEYTITPQASQILTESLGTELSVVSNELNKLVIAVKDTNKITPEHIEKHIGLSKDFNVLELQDALGTRNILKANRIINYFSANPQKHPIQMTISILFGYFSKVFSCHFINDKSDEGVRTAMNLHPFYAKKIAAASKRYTPAKLYEIIGILREYDMKSKGVGVSPLSEPGDLQKEMIYKILH
jgi:DNA polymerase-3 subunit delta